MEFPKFVKNVHSDSRKDMGRIKFIKGHCDLAKQILATTKEFAH